MTWNRSSQSVNTAFYSSVFFVVREITPASRFMLWLGPTSSVFDIATYLLLYFVLCPLATGGQLYTGWTNDPAARLRAHRSGRGARYTRAHGAEGFAYLERCADRCAALRREAALKKLPKAQKELLCTAWQAAGRPFAEHGAGSAG